MPTETEDLIVLRATSTFWFDYQHARPARFVHVGQLVEIRREDFALYGEVCQILISGSLEAPAPKKGKKFTDQILEKAKSVFAPAPGVAVRPVPVTAPVAEEPHSPDATFPCPSCDAVFSAPQGLAIHAKNAHSTASKVKDSEG